MAGLTAFDPRPLPAVLAHRLLARIDAAHRAQPFSVTDARATVRRMVEVLAELGMEGTVYRGGLDLRGAEVDHVWLAVARPDDSATVLDVAFPLLDGDFVEVLRRFVAGDATTAELDAAGLRAGIRARVLGDFPVRMRYVGRPVWGTAEHGG
jgi:hypothetical protein